METVVVCSTCSTVNEEKTLKCPDCGSEDSWDLEPKYSIDTDDLPIVFSSEVYDDRFKLWDDFCASYFGERHVDKEDVENIPQPLDDKKSMKYQQFTVYYVINTHGRVEGPFLEEPDRDDF